MTDHDRLLKAVGRRPLAISSDWLYAALHQTKIAKTSAAARPAIESRTSRGIGVIPLYGFIDARPSWLLDFFGGTALTSFSRTFDEMVADSEIRSVVVDIDSPGGSTQLVEETAAQIFAARKKKPITAFCSGLMASAAYWIGSSASRIICTPSGEVGSIGVWSLLAEQSKALENEGIKVTLVRSTTEKTWGNPYEPLPADAKAYFQSEVDDIYRKFLGDVARNRGTSSATVASMYGRGCTLLANRALTSGMVDSIGDFASVMGSLQTRPATNAGSRAISGGMSQRQRTEWLRQRSSESDAERFREQVETASARAFRRSAGMTATDRAKRLAELSAG